MVAQCLQRSLKISVLKKRSKLGPLLFDIYANNFNKLCTDDENVLYTADAVLVYVSNNLDELTNHVNERLRMINEWCNKNKLLLYKLLVVAIRMNFSYQFVKIWNEIPIEIKNSTSLGIFKKSLINH